MRKGAVLCLSLLTVLAACGKKEAAAPAAKAAPAPAPAKESAPAATTAATTFGVPECDEYLEKYLACIDTHVPEAARAQVRVTLDQTRAAWQQAAATPEGKAGLATGCRQATEMARTAMSAYGCTF
jgi:hypothetical protein